MSGERVTQTNANKLSAYYAALRNRAEDLAKLPLQLRRRRTTGRGSDIERGHAVARLLKRPNPMMGSFEFRRLMEFRCKAWGYSPAEIVRSARGEPVQLWPVHPSRLTPKMTDDGTRRIWERADGGEPIDDINIFAVHNIEWMSLLSVAAEAIGVGIAAQKQSARMFSEGMAKRLIAIVSEALNPKGRAGLRKRIKGEDPQGDDGGPRLIPIIEGDTRLIEAGIDPKDAQMLELQEFTVEVIARFARMPLAKLMSHKRAQGWSTLEALNTDYVTDALLPDAIGWEDEIDAKLLRGKDQDVLFAKHVFNGLLRGDSAARTAYYGGALINGWLSRNEVRDLEDMNPIDGEPGEGDEYTVQRQMIPLSDVGTESEAPVAQQQPEPEPDPEPEEDDEDDEMAKALAALPEPGTTRSEVIEMTHDAIRYHSGELAKKAAQSVSAARKKHDGNDVRYASWLTGHSKWIAEAMSGSVLWIAKHASVDAETWDATIRATAHEHADAEDLAEAIEAAAMEMIR